MKYSEELVSIAEAARILEVCPQTILNYRRRGLLTPIAILGLGPGKPVLYERKEVEDLVARRMDV